MRNFRRFNIKNLARTCAAVLALGVATTSARADSLSTLSQLSAVSVISVPVAFSTGVTTLSVQGVRALGEVLELSVRGAGQASEFSIKVPAAMAGGLSLAAGTVIEVVSDGVGHLLRVSGKIIGFIPSELGKSLLHHAPIGHTGQHKVQQTKGRL